MGRPPGRRDEPVRRIHLEWTLLACERDLQPVEEPREAAVGLDRALPRPRQRRGVVDGDQAEPKAAIGEPARQVELRDVAAEEVLEVDGGHEQVDPLWRFGADVELERLAPSSDSARVPGWVVTGCARAPLRARRHARVAARTARGQLTSRDQPDRMPPRDAPEQRALDPERLVAADQPPRAPKPEPGHRPWRALAVGQQAYGAPLSRCSSGRRTGARAPSRTGAGGRPPRSRCLARPPSSSGAGARACRSRPTPRRERGPAFARAWPSAAPRCWT